MLASRDMWREFEIPAEFQVALLLVMKDIGFVDLGREDRDWDYTRQAEIGGRADMRTRELKSMDAGSTGWCPRGVRVPEYK